MFRAHTAMPALLGACALLVACGDDRRLQDCEPGEVLECACDDGLDGLQSCSEQGRLDACDCSEARRVCDVGDARDCTCLDGRLGRQVCTEAGGFGGCACGQDGGVPPSDSGTGDGCVAPDDSDGDGLSDCAELTDGDSWTDPAVFNGLAASLRATCAGAAMACDGIGDPAVAEGCATGVPVQSLDQYAGWDFGSAVTGGACAEGYGFGPGWTSCPEPFSVVWDGFIQLPEGRHCFAVTASRSQACGAFYLSVLDEASFPGWTKLGPLSLMSVHGGPVDSSVDCRTMTAGVYPIRLFFNAWGPDHAYRVRYCRAEGDDCAPGRALPSGMLRPTL